MHPPSLTLGANLDPNPVRGQASWRSRRRCECGKRRGRTEGFRSVRESAKFAGPRCPRELLLDSPNFH